MVKFNENGVVRQLSDWGYNFTDVEFTCNEDNELTFTFTEFAKVSCVIDLNSFTYIDSRHITHNLQVDLINSLLKNIIQ
jgi:hypothetical protein